VYLPETFAARRVCTLAGQIYWVRPLSIEGWATLLAWLDDFVPGRDERECPPEFGSEETQAQLRTPAGQSLVTWLALEESGVSFEQAARLVDDAQPLELVRLWHIVFSHRRTAKPEPGGKDISEMWCGPGLATCAFAIGLKDIGKLTLDQLEWLGTDGKADDHASPSSRGYQRAMQMYEEAVAQQSAPVENN
jgi:hypothetical protein